MRINVETIPITYRVRLAGMFPQETRRFVAGDDTASETTLLMTRADVESLILQLTGQLAKIDQDAATAKEKAQ